MFTDVCGLYCLLGYKEYFKCQLLTKYQDLLQHEVLGGQNIR